MTKSVFPDLSDVMHPTDLSIVVGSDLVCPADLSDLHELNDLYDLTDSQI